jgi:hypothetical protein
MRLKNLVLLALTVAVLGAAAASQVQARPQLLTCTCNLHFSHSCGNGQRCLKYVCSGPSGWGVCE